MKKFLVALLVCLLALVPVLANALEVGDEAPQFEAVSDKGPINLMDYRGKKNVVHYWPSRKTSRALKT
jgi:peroxiredoxin